MRLAGIANSTALLIDGDMHQMLMDKYPLKDGIDSVGDDMYYQLIHQKLMINEKANMLKTPIYTIVYDSTIMAYEFGITSADKPYFRHVYKGFPAQLLEQYNQGGTIPPYKDEFGHWLSAFAPIKNKLGKTVAVLQADERYDLFIAQARSAVWQNVILSLVLIGVLFFVLMRILHHILSRELKDKVALNEANESNKNMSLQLAQSLDELKKTDEFRKEMIANFSHDLRTPLASVSGYLELLLQDQGNLINPEDKENYLKIAYSEAQRLKRLVNELFELSKLESGQVKLQEERFSLPELAQDVLNKYQVDCKEKNIDLLTDFQSDLHLIHGDISWIDRLLQNLLDNAVKHCNHGGFIKLTISENNQTTQEVKVCNSGDPIPQAHLPYVFDRYFRSTNRKTQSSSGLGLAIVKKIVDIHHGGIRAEATDQVTTFRFWLPLS